MIFQAFLGFEKSYRDELAGWLVRYNYGISRDVLNSPPTDCLGGKNVKTCMEEFQKKHAPKKTEQTGGGRGGWTKRGRGKWRGRGRGGYDRGGRGGYKKGYGKREDSNDQRKFFS